MCISNFTLCSESASKSCVSDKAFSFSGEKCAAQDMSCCQNKTLDYGNYDYEHISGFMTYTTSGFKRILIECEEHQLQLEPGDVFGVRFSASGPAAALKTSLSGSSFYYSSSVVNRTSSTTLRGNRLPSTDDSPTQVPYVPAIALVHSAHSESRLENVYQAVGHENIILSVGNSIARVNYTKSICLQETITGLQLDLPEAFPYGEIVNLTAGVEKGTNVTFIWDFGDKSNATSLTPWVTNVYNSVGEKTVKLQAGNNIALQALWCSVVIQERIAELRFKNDSLLAIENGTTARIAWMLFNGSHVNFNITITYPTGEVHSRNLTDAKAPGARFFAIYKRNLTETGWYLITITATNKLNNMIIAGNLSVQYAVQGVVINYPRILKTNETFNFTILPHQGDEMARYSLQTMDGKITNTSEKVIPHVYTKAGKYNVILIAINDVSSMVINCAEIIVQDVIDGLQYTSFNHNVAVQAEAEIYWRLTQGTGLYILIDYGDGITKLVNGSLSVSDVFVAISKHNYTKPGEYHVEINVRNLVDNQTINTTVYVETPGQGPGLALGRGTLAKAEGGPCTRVLYVAVNDSVTATATASNGTNMNGLIDFGDDSIDRRLYFRREFPDDGWTTNHSYSTAGVYNISVTFFNRNPQNISYTCRVIVQYPVSVVIVTSNSPRRSSDSTVTLDVSFPGYEPSGPLSYQWKHGDNTSTLLQNNKTKIHTYPNKCGVYIATVNVSNEISYGIGIEEIVIQDEVQGLEYFANYTEYVNTCGPEFSLPHNIFPADYKVSFNASITSGTNVSFNWSFLDDGDYRLGMRSSYKFRNFGVNKVQIMAKNNVSNQTKEFSITLEKSILGVVLTNDGPSVQKQALNFTLQVEQVGDDSCFSIDLKDDVEGDDETPSTLVYFKSSSSPLNPCQSKHEIIQSPQRFSHIYSEAQKYDVTLKARNRVSCHIIPHPVAVAKGRCIFPIISAPGIGLNIANGTRFKRSERIIIKTLNKINCFDLNTEFRWEVYKMCEVGSQPVRLTVEEKPGLQHINKTRPELTFPPRFFHYCKTLELRFMINMTKADGVFSEKKMYIVIEKSPLIATIKGGSERTVGNEEPVEIDASHSYDPDNSSEGPMDSDCKFAWFCKREDEIYTLPKDLNNLPPIPTTPPQVNTTGNSSAGNFTENLGGCFGYGPGQLNVNSPKITLNTVKMTPNTTYDIRFVMTKEGRGAFFADQRIKVLPGDPPSLSVE